MISGICGKGVKFLNLTGIQVETGKSGSEIPASPDLRVSLASGFCSRTPSTIEAGRESAAEETSDWEEEESPGATGSPGATEAVADRLEEAGDCRDMASDITSRETSDDA